MAIADGHILEVSVSGHASASLVMNVIDYHVDSGAVAATAEDVGEAWWNAVKAWWRAFAVTNFTTLFQTVTVRDITDLSGPFGTFGIPLAEQAGTRTPGASGENLPNFCAVGIRLNVPTRTTRPGQKRLLGVNESDQSTGQLTPAAVAAAQAWGDAAVQTVTLLSPAPLVVLTPVVVSRNEDGSAGPYQNMTSATVRDQVTTQNSRKSWRGA